MKRFKKLNIAILVICLFFSMIPLQVFATTDLEQFPKVDSMVVYTQDANAKIGLYEEMSIDSRLIAEISNGTEVFVLEKHDGYTNVQYEEPESKEILQGYVKSEHLIPVENEGVVDQTNSAIGESQEVEPGSSQTNSAIGESQEVEPESSQTNSAIGESQEVEPESSQTNSTIGESQEVEPESSQTNSTIGESQEVEPESSQNNSTIGESQEVEPESSQNNSEIGESQEVEPESSQINSEISETQAVEPELSQTNEQEEMEDDVKSLDDTSNTNQVQLTTFSSNTELMEPTKEVTGSTTVLEGIAIKFPTNMYESPSRDSEVLRTFNPGKVLKYYNHSSEWFRSTVSIDGKNRTIYIHKSDVEEKVKDPELLEGLALKDPTNLYALPTRDSEVLRSFNSGKVLKYYTFSTNWYKSSVSVNGKIRTIYIHKSDVGIAEPVTDPVLVQGIALKNPTNMYSLPSRDSKVLRTFNSGKELKFYTYIPNWYSSTVKVNGIDHTIYIHESDVELLVDKPIKEEGIAWINPTNVYALPSRNSKVLRKFSPGSILKYYTYSDNWYKSSTTVNGKVNTIFIHSADIEEANPSSETLQGIALNSETSVHVLPSSGAQKLKTYSKGSTLKFYNYSKNWYKTTVRNQVGYIKKSNIGSVEKSGPSVIKKNTHYDYSFSDMIDIQVTKTPKVDGAGQFIASRSLVEYYANPLNFEFGTDEYYQFLVLSKPAGLSATEINQNILYDKGILKGKGQVFIDAANIHQVNEAYLIAHTLHETGFGESTLSNGIPVDENGNVTRDSLGNISVTEKTYEIVYNMYGYGAVDNDPIDGGAKYAFDRGWFSPELAIIGGAQEVVANYISQGQDTLYKMRWNPANPGEHQYATHVIWATAQTKNIASIYRMLNSFTLNYDVPNFNGSLATSTKPAAEDQYAVLPVAEGITGKTTENVNLRTYPTGPIIRTLDNGTNIEVVGQNGGWYKVRLSGELGWLSGDYVSLENALQITTSALNVRNQPNTTSSSIIGTIYNGEIVSGVIDSNGDFIKSGNWYKINYKNAEGWISGGYVKELK
ncbi:SH3 domain-containing protein [Niallia sp. XMNu-256]|uniref:SH3 domain-containing protein n=1 Tax=Niallia sp. XMNu-256 TaxID=3082444 RepID=UPI0030D3B038